MLKHRQLVELTAAVIEQARYQFRLDRGAGFSQRLANDFLTLAARHAWNEKLGSADQFRQTPKVRAVANKVGPHGDEHMRLGFSAPGSLDQELDERFGFIERLRLVLRVFLIRFVRPCKTEQL